MAILYGKEDFLCRRCRGVTYRPRRVPARSRDLARAQMGRIRLGGTGDMTVSLPERPKGMHEWTYTRLSCRALAAEIHANNTLLDQLGRSKRATSDLGTKEAGEALPDTAFGPSPPEASSSPAGENVAVPSAAFAADEVPCPQATSGWQNYESYPVIESLAKIHKTFWDQGLNPYHAMDD